MLPDASPQDASWMLGCDNFTVADPAMNLSTKTFVCLKSHFLPNMLTCLVAKYSQDDTLLYVFTQHEAIAKMITLHEVIADKQRVRMVKQHFFSPQYTLSLPINPCKKCCEHTRLVDNKLAVGGSLVMSSVRQRSNIYKKEYHNNKVYIQN